MKRFFLALLFVAACGLARAQTPAASPVASATPRGAVTPGPTAIPIVTATPRPLSKTVTAATYRDLLQSALNRLNALPSQAQTDVRPIIKPLDTPFTVKRADGQTQTVRGDEWNQTLTGMAGGISGINAAKLSRTQRRVVQNSLEKRLKELDAWATPGAKGYYTSVDAQKIVNDAVANNRIRVGPPPLQLILGQIKTAILDGIEAFFKWLSGLFPKSTPTTSAPNLSWLWFVFWGIVVGLLGFLLFLAVRALAGGSFAVWGIGRRRRKSPEELRDEDAELFGLAPEELRDRADIFASQGNYREALRHRFISLLVLLDARGTWRYDVRRTNWEHIAGLRRDEGKRPLVAPLSTLTRAFDRVRYGGAACDEDSWNQFQSGVREVESLVGGKAVAR